MDSNDFWDSRSQLRSHILMNSALTLPNVFDISIQTSGYSRILDVGCGNGELSSLTGPGDYYGIDSSGPSIETARLKRGEKKKSFILGDYLCYNFKDVRFDAIYFIYSLFCMQNLPFAITKSRSLLKKDGQLIIYSAVDDITFRRKFFHPGFYGYNSLFNPFCVDDIRVFLRENRFIISGDSDLGDATTKIRCIVARSI